MSRTLHFPRPIHRPVSARVALGLVVAMVLMSLPALADGPTIDTWPATASSKLNCFSKSYFEPSGAVPANGFLYVVSDNGQVGRQTLGQDGCSDGDGSFDSQHMPGEPDYESIAFAPSLGNLYIGVEGGDTPARIVELAPPASTERLKDRRADRSLTGWAWTLDLPVSGANGMEGMTFVPDGHHGLADAGAPFNGLFLAASQKEKGKIFFYKLDRPTEKPTQDLTGTRLTDSLGAPLLAEKISDLYYSEAKKRLYVLYDEGSSSKKSDCSSAGRWLQVLALVESGGKKVWTQSALYAPVFDKKTNAEMHGMEAVAVWGSDLYIGLDQLANQAVCNNACRDKKCDDWLNPIYRYTGF